MPEFKLKLKPPPPMSDAHGKIPSSSSTTRGDLAYIDAVFGEYIPNRSMVMTGTCIEYNGVFRDISVLQDVYKTAGSSMALDAPPIKALWGREKLSEAEVLGKRVRMFIYNKKVKETDGSAVGYRVYEVKELTLLAIAPDNAPSNW